MAEQLDVARRSWLRRWLNRMEVDQAVFFALLTRAWQFLAGPVSMFLIAMHFTPELQGYFYTFASLMGLQVLIELGLHVVIINVSSHEWSKLHLDEGGNLSGDPNALHRLVSLGRQFAAWYGVASLVFTAVAIIGGVLFFSQKPLPAHQWMPQWTSLAILSGLLLWTMPFVAVLEGCNQVATVNKFRASQAVAGNLVVWACIAMGAGLWAAVASTAVRLVWECYLLSIRYRRFFAPFVSIQIHSPIHWWSEIWPLQWRLAVPSVLQYVAFFLFTPVMFQFHGAAVAGQMGMTWSVLTTLQAAAFSWVQTRTPLFGVLVARKDYAELDRVFKRLSMIAVFVLIAGGVLFWIAILCIYIFPHPLAEQFAKRVLPPLPTAVFTIAVVLICIPQCQSAYLLAHKRNPLLIVGILGNTAIGIGVCLMGARFGPLGAGISLLVVVAAFTVPASTWIWFHCRRQWHEPAPVVIRPSDAQR